MTEKAEGKKPSTKNIAHAIDKDTFMELPEPGSKQSNHLDLEKEWSNLSEDSAQPHAKRKKYKASSTSSLTSEQDEEVSKLPIKPQLPKPLDLYEGNINDGHQGGMFRRATRIFEIPTKNTNVRCEHEVIEDWTCKNCKTKLSQFDCILDDNGGKIEKNFRIIYENQFIQDFLNEQTTQLMESDSSNSEEEKKDGESSRNPSPKKEDRSNPDVVYTQYEPRNVAELREYMFFCVCRQLQELESWNIEREERTIQRRMEMKAEMERRNQQLRQQIARERSVRQNADLIDMIESSPEPSYKGTNETLNNGSKLIGMSTEKEVLEQLEVSISQRPKQYFVPFPLDARMGNGRMKNLSPRLTKYLQDILTTQDRLIKKHKGNVLLFDSVFESGNLLRADRIMSQEYRLYMQVDTNTKGHQQWFYFRVRNTMKGKTYKFMIMNFTKPGLTAGNGYRKNELFQRVMFKSRKNGSEEWQVIGNDKLAYEKTKVQRRKKDVAAGGDDSDQEDWIEEAFGLNDNAGAAQNQGIGLGQPGDGKGVSADQKEAIASLKKKKRFYYYALVFNVEFEHDDDTVFFAFSQPYPYTQIITEIIHAEDEIKKTAEVRSPDKIHQQQTQANDQIERVDTKEGECNLSPNPQADDFEDNERPRANANKIKNPTEANIPATVPEKSVSYEDRAACLYYKRQELCRTVGGLPVWMITISREAKKDKKKPVIVVTSRVHSGETPASIVFKGIFDFLVSDCKEARFLRKFYTFILIPCLNPDGVVCGNYRNCAAGLDLNRQWIAPEVEFQPEIFHTKKMFTNLTEVERRQIWIYCDIHGHSKKQNAFFYGCNTAANGGFLSWTIVRLLPRIFAQKTHMFNIKDCRFKVEPYKIGTGRVVAWKQFQITHSFTLENSFYGYERGEDEVVEFSVEDYQGIGAKFAESIYEMHFVWKQIRRELQITNGWLKPKVLFETTGVPAAQILSEELEKKKKAEQKQIAIEQYQLFLKKFYNGGKNSASKNKQNTLQDQTLNYPFAFQMGPTNSSIPLNIYNKQNVPGQGLKASKFAQGRGLDKLGGSTEELTEFEKSPLIKSQFKVYPQRNQFNNDLDGGNSELDPIQMLEKSLSALVKLQARVRGMIARKRVNKLLSERNKKNGINVIKQKPRLGREVSASIQKGKHKNSNSVLQTFQTHRSDLLRSNSLTDELKQNTSENSLDQELLPNDRKKNPMQSSKDSLSGSNFERMSTRRMNLLTKDWRLYFQQKELDQAFQVVEIEKREISEEGSSAESASNPSEDNLEAEEIYEKVFNLPPQKREEMIQKKKEQVEKLRVQIKEANKDVLQKAKEQQENRLQAAARNVQTGIPSRRGTLKFYRGFNNKNNSGTNINNEIGSGLVPGGGQGQDTSGQARYGEAGQWVGQSPYFHYNQNFSGSTNIQGQQNIQRNSSAHSPMNAFEQKFSMHDFNLSTKNIAFNQINGRGLQINKYRDGTKNRATTSHGTTNPSISNPAVIQSTHYQNFVGPNNNQMRIFNLNYKQPFGKRENINQVIKDCFITKKFGVKKPAAPTNQSSNLNYIYDSNQPSCIIKKRNLASSEPQKNVNRQNELTFNSNHSYYTNAGTNSGKKTRRLKRNKSPQSSQVVNQPIMMHIHPDFYNAAHSQQMQANTSMFMHPNYPFVPAIGNTNLPLHNSATLQHSDYQHQQRMQQVRMQAMSMLQANPHPNIQMNIRNQVMSSLEQQPKRGQVVRVQIAGKNPMINPQRNQTGQFIRPDQIQHPDQPSRLPPRDSI